MKDRIEGPDILRGFAASLIIVLHLVFLTGVKYPGVVFCVSRHFNIGVPLFFAISGFAIAYNYGGDELFSKVNLKNFYIKRFFRIAPLFWFMMFVELAFMFVCKGKSSYPLREIFLSFFFVFPFVPSCESSAVWAGWSIGVEVVFYLLFPIIILFLKNKKSAILSFFIFLVASIIIGYIRKDAKGAVEPALYRNISYHLVYFITGIIIYYFLPDINRLKKRLGNHSSIVSLLGLIFTIIVIVIYYMYLKNIIPSQIVLSIAWIIIISLSIIGFPVIIENQFTNYLGKMSYSIYLVHPFLIIALANFGFFSFISSRLNSVLAFIVSLIFILAITYISSFILYSLIERPFMRFGKKFLS